MKPKTKWITDWRFGVEPELEKKTSEELLVIFQDFWNGACLETKSKSTKQRYAGALHALGGYLVEEGVNGIRGDKSIYDFLKGYIDSGDGPLIYYDNEAWQSELDTVCRKLYQFLVAQC